MQRALQGKLLCLSQCVMLVCCREHSLCFDRVLVLTQAFRANPIHAAYLREANAAELEQALNPTVHVASNVQPLQRRPP